MRRRRKYVEVFFDAIHVVFVLFVSLFAVTCWGQQSCLRCTSEKFLNADFSNLDVFEDRNCEMGVTLSEYRVACGFGNVCITIDGIASYYIQGFGLTDTKLVIRDCVNVNYFTDASTCLEDREANSFVRSIHHQLVFEDAVSLSSFDGTVCPCEDRSYCNNQVISPVVVRRPHTPAPGGKGLQCVTCLDVDVRGLPQYDYDNPSCEAGDLKHSDVFYHTCSQDGACVVIDGVVTEFGIQYSLYQKVCVHGFLDQYPPSDKLTCLPPYEAEVVVTSILLSEDYYYFGYDITFDGSLCYCTSDLCNLDSEGGWAHTVAPSNITVILSLLLGAVVINIKS